MTRHQRGSDGPVPHGPSGQPTPPTYGTPTAPPLAPPPWSPAGGEVPPTSLPPAPNLAPPPPPVGGPKPGFGAPPPVAQWAPPPGAYSTAVRGAPGLQHGRTLDRAMAWLLDGFLLSIPDLILRLIVLNSVTSGAGPGADALSRFDGVLFVAGVITVGINPLYFVGFWTGHARATFGMRLMKLQIGDAETGALPTVRQGVVRWLSLGGFLWLVALVPVLVGAASLGIFIWTLVLLATTATSPTKQGLHDRMARTAMVQPAGAQTPAQACLILLVLGILGFIAFVAVVDWYAHNL